MKHGCEAQHTSPCHFTIPLILSQDVSRNKQKVFINKKLKLVLEGFEKKFNTICKLHSYDDHDTLRK